MATETFIIDVRTRGTKKSAADVKRIGTSASQVRKTLAFLRAALVTVAAVRVFATLTTDLVAFSDEMLVVKAVTNATTTEFVKLREVAKGLGATTRFTAAEAAEGMAFLARAGFDVTEVISAIPATLNLAAAAQLELGNAADIASNLMTSFGRTTAELPDIIDTLVFTANNANTTVQQLADGLKLFAPIASQLGVSLKEASSAMAVLGDAGIQASLAGTGVRRVLTDLEAPTGALAKALDFMGIAFEDVRPSAVGLAGALQVLKDNNVGASASSLLFGKRGGFVAAQLLRALGPMGDFNEALADIDGTAKRVADEMESGLGGALRLVRSAFQNLLITFGDLGTEEFLNQFFRDLAEGLRVVARNADDVVAAIKVLFTVFAVAKITPIIVAMGAAAVAAAVFAFNTAALAVSMGTLAGAAGVLTGALISLPFVLILTTLTLLTAGFVLFRDEIKLTEDGTVTLADAFTAAGETIGKDFLNVLSLVGIEAETWGDIVETVSMRVGNAFTGILAVLNGLLAAVKIIFNDIEFVVKASFLAILANLLRLKSGINNLLSAVGADPLFNLDDDIQQMRDLGAEVAALKTNVETVGEAFFRGGRDFLATVETAAAARRSAELDAAILATEDANRLAAQARIVTTPEEVDAGRTDLAAALRGGGEADKAAKEIERLTEALRGLEVAHFPLLTAQDDLAETMAIINDAAAKGIKLRVDEAELLKRVARERIGANMTVAQAAEEQQVLRQELDKTNISLAEFEFLSRKASIAFLEGQRDAASGAERAFLKLQQDATDAAAFTEMVMTDAFKTIEDAVVSFAETGTFSVNEFFRNFAAQLIRLGTQQAIAGIGSAFPGVGAGAGVQTGGGAGIGGLFTSLLGLHEGGAFKVGASSAAASLPGIDNRLVAFRAQDGEDVTVTPKNQIAAGGSAAGATNIVFNVNAKDADSFNRSRSQLQNRLLAGIGQARRRR